MVRNEHRYRRPQAGGAEKLLAERAYLHEAQRLGQVGSWAFNTPSGYLLRIFGYRSLMKEIRRWRCFEERVHPQDLPSFEGNGQQGQEERKRPIMSSDYRICSSGGIDKAPRAQCGPPCLLAIPRLTSLSILAPPWT